MKSAPAIIEYWFSDEVKPLWFNSTPAFDVRLRDEFVHVYQQAAAGELSDWESNADGALALVILLDQIPLNIFRGLPESFATEAAARAVAQRAIENKRDTQLSDEQKAFLYLPYMHSESLADQDRSVELYELAGLDGNLEFARHHRDIVKRFGRFPHRNRILGRKSTQQEKNWLESDEAFKG